MVTGAVKVGRTVGVGTITRGAGATAAGAGGAAGAFTGGGATGGLASTAGVGATGLGAGVGGAEGVCCLRIAFKTSPGREMWDRSILVLISSPSGRLDRDARAVACDSPAAARKCARTFSASCSSRELECVFFSVTPTSRSTSRIALLLTSSSLARSLTRILLIRPFFLRNSFP